MRSVRLLAGVGILTGTVVVAATGSPATASATGPTEPYTYQSTLIGPGSADMYPVAVTADSNYYYVIDAGHYRIVAVNRSTGNIDFQSALGGGSGPGQIGDARAIAIDPNGNLWVADSGNNRIEEFTTDPDTSSPTIAYDGQFGQKGAGCTASDFQGLPYGVATGPGVDGSGNPTTVMYVVDGAGFVDKYSLTGAFLGCFAEGMFKAPRQVAVDPNTGNVFVVDSGHEQVDVFNESGTQLYTFGQGYFTNAPRGIALYGGMVFVTDAGGDQVEAWQFTNSGATYLPDYLITGYGSGASQKFTGPRGLVVTSDGRLLVTDEWGFGLDQFDVTQDPPVPTNQWFGQGPPAFGVNVPKGLAIAANGDMCVNDYWDMRVECVTPAGSFDFKFGFRGGKTRPGSINFAWATAVQPSTGDFFVANRESNNIEVFGPTGDFITQWGTHGTACGDINLPQGIAFAPNGNLVLADTSNGRIEEWTITSPSSPGTNPVCYGQKGRRAQGPGYFDAPTGVSVAADGTIWVADTNDNQIQSLSPDGTTWTTYIGASKTGKNGKTSTIGFRHPQGVTVGPDGNIWVANTNKNSIVEMTPSGSLIFSADGVDLGAGPLNGPFAIAVGAGGLVYVSDSGNSRVIVLAPA
jgi:DNA-binding beta-propeller fold protein YncE